MTEKETKLLARLRSEIGDTVEPYRFTDNDLLALIQEAIADYSRHRPRPRKGILTIMPGTSEYNLPPDYQTWIGGLEGYEILDRTLYLPNPPVLGYEQRFNYLADHSIESFPERDVNMLLDYSMWKLLENIVSEGAEISGLKLGKGLDIKFDNFDQITVLAKQRKDRYHEQVAKPFGVWC